MGRLIPAGTGATMSKLREVATRRDEMNLAQGAADSQAPANEAAAIEPPQAAELAALVKI